MLRPVVYATLGKTAHSPTAKKLKTPSKDGTGHRLDFSDLIVAFKLSGMREISLLRLNYQKN